MCQIPDGRKRGVLFWKELDKKSHTIRHKAHLPDMYYGGEDLTCCLFFPW